MSDGPVFLHVGLKKTGTSYLQEIFRANEDALAAQGLSMVPGSQIATRQLVRALKGQLQEGIDGPRARRALVRLPRELDEAPGDRVLITDEVFGGSTPEQVTTLGKKLGPREVHLVLTVRDLARTIPSAWQQTIKGGSAMPYDDFVASVVSGEGEAANGFWRAYGVPELLQRWAHLVPPERMHLVVLPQPGAAPTVLLERFCSVLGIDPATLPPAANRANEALGRGQAELLRRLNEGWSDLARRRDLHNTVIKRGFGLRVLSPLGGDRIRLPAQYRPWVEEHTARTIDTLRQGGFAVVGELGELQAPDSAFAVDLPPVDEAMVAEAATQALHVLLENQVAELYQHRIERAAQRRLERGQERDEQS
ncbi:hypothetical protein [Nocardioides panacisoli]|uniref:Sulfotransferase family protein n=1 Tax=Nocardioides panacisoli TaxID=627624 RepID=A0ABP7IDD1_9ACTN